MPAMRLFGRRCLLATDDFFLIGLIDFTLFLPWLSWAPVVYASFLQHKTTCDNDLSLLLLEIWLPILTTLFAANWLLAAFFAIFSSRGTISQSESRRHVVTLVYVKIVISILDMFCVSLGTYLFYDNNFCDALGVPSLLKASTIFLWLATAVRILMAIFLVDWSCRTAGKKDYETKEFIQIPVKKTSSHRWQLRLHNLFMCFTTPTEARQQAIRSFAEVIAVTCGGMDFVASDMLAGLLLYRQESFYKFRLARRTGVIPPPISTTDGEILDKFPPDDWPEWMNLQDAYHFMRLGMGVYGWCWYLYRNLACGFCKLMCNITCCFGCRKASEHVRGDNCCGCKLAGLRAFSGFPHSDVVFVDFKDCVFQVPYFVCLDHSHRSVLVSVRGTMSVDDVLTDCAGDLERMTEEDAVCHRGILCAARRIKAELEDGLLQRAFEQAPGYRLVFTGHSLGASVAALVTLLLRHEYPDVRCYAFAPPPFVNEPLMAVAEKHIFSLVYGQDVVLNIKYDTIHMLLKNIERCILECRLPKYKVYFKGGKIFGNPKENDCDVEAITKRNGINQENYGTVSPLSSEELPTEPSARSFVVGKILHIRRYSKGGLRLKIRSACEFDEIVLRPKMVRHHFPEIMLNALEELGKEPVVTAQSLCTPDDTAGSDEV